MKRARTIHAGVWVSIGLFVLGCPADEDTALPSIVPAGAEPGRWVLLDGASNTRDLGGYANRQGQTVRYGTVYRSATLSRLTAAGCQTFKQLGVRRVIDFRNRLAPSPLFDGDAVCVFESSKMSLLPVLSQTTDVPEERYSQTVVRYADSYRQAFDLIADDNNLPLLFHCAAGKDRTGIMAVLLLTLLGVDRADVIADYELSDLVAAPVSTGCVVELLDEIDRQGGIEAYLANIGVSAAAQNAIRRALLE